MAEHENPSFCGKRLTRSTLGYFSVTFLGDEWNSRKPPPSCSDSAMFSKLSIRTKIVSVVCLLLLALAGMGLLSGE